MEIKKLKRFSKEFSEETKSRINDIIEEILMSTDHEVRVTLINIAQLAIIAHNDAKTARAKLDDLMEHEYGTCSKVLDVLYEVINEYYDIKVKELTDEEKE